MIEHILFFVIASLGIAPFTLFFIFSIGKIAILEGEEDYLDEKRILSFIGKHLYRSFCPYCLNGEISVLFFFGLWFFNIEFTPYDLVYIFPFLGLSNSFFGFLKNNGYY
jgi:hypothetical protein